MAFLDIKNVKISGMSACVPSQKEHNADVYEKWGGYEDFVKTTGIETRRKASKDICSSDLCISAAEKLIEDLKWNKEDIDAIIFVSQTPDYITPATSCIIQEKLKLSEDCYTLDISLGCSGWVYALSVVSSLLQNGCMKKALLLAGDTLLKFCAEEDKSTYPLFGDAGTVTAIEYAEGEKGMHFVFNTDGAGAEAIIIKDGGYRNETTINSLNPIIKGEGIISNNLQLELDGMNVFSFGISKAPKSVKTLIEKFEVDKDSVNYFFFHQANKFMNDMIRKQLKLKQDRVPYSLKDFGNTSCASIPITMITQVSDNLRNESLQHIACGFGVGLSWGSVYFETKNIIVSELIEI